jgi:hypothetical protein
VINGARHPAGAVRALTLVARHLAVRLCVRLGEQVREDGEDPAIVVLARWETELVEDRAHTLLHRSLAEGRQQSRDDLRIEGGAAVCNAPQRACEARRVGRAVLEQ